MSNRSADSDSSKKSSSKNQEFNSAQNTQQDYDSESEKNSFLDGPSTTRQETPQVRDSDDLVSAGSERHGSTIARQFDNDEDMTDSELVQEEEDIVIQKSLPLRLDDDYEEIVEPNDMDAETVDFSGNEEIETAKVGDNDNMNQIIFSDDNSIVQERDLGTDNDDDDDDEEVEEEEEEDDASSRLDYVELNYIERGDTPMEEKRIEDSKITKKKTIAPTLTVEELDDAIATLFEGFLPGTPTIRLKRILEDILPYSLNIRKYGLRSDHFRNSFYLLSSRVLFPATVKKYLLFLLPREEVSEQFVVKIIGRLSRAGEDIRLVDAFLKWAIVIFDCLDSTEIIRKLYPVMFHYLGFKTTRASICHLLYFLTRKEDVTPYRIRKLKSLVDQEKNNRALIGLLMVYNSFDRSVEIPVNIRLSDMFVFEHPNPAMRVELKQIKEYWGDDRDVLVAAKPRFRLPRRQHEPSHRKRSKLSEENDESGVEDINMMGIFGDILQLPHSNQLQRILGDRKIQHLLVCNPNDDAIQRLSYYLGHQLLTTVRWNNNRDKHELHDLLKRLLRLAQFSKSQLAIVNLFLREYLRSWNGIEFRDEILGLISFIKPADYQELYQNILLPLYRKYYVLDVTFKAKLINCYTDWLKNWALLDWRGHKEQEETSDTDVDKVTWMFEGLSLRVDYFVTIQKVIEHVDKISIVGLLAENDDPLLQHATLSFFELVASIPLQHDIPEIIVPSIDLVCRCFFASNAMALSRICGIICQYVIAFSENDKKEDDWLSRHSPDYLTMFNTYVTDVCNALWKNKALKIGGNAMAFALSEENIENFTATCNIRGDELGSFSSLTQSGALAGFSKSFLNELETEERAEIHHNEAVTAESLHQLQEQGGISIDYFEYRVKFLNYLSSKGLDGIQDLLCSSMKSLIKYQQEHLL